MKIGMMPGVLAASVLLSACSVHEPALPESDQIIDLRVNDNGMTAVSRDYVYYFDNQRGLYDRWKALSQEYGNHVRGMAIHFEVDKRDVEAQYNTWIDEKGLSAQQRLDLTQKYAAVPAKTAGQQVVTFRATGHWGETRNFSQDSSFQQMNPPITVTISDKTRGVNPLWVPVMVPAFPFIMVYGCATGPCV